MDDRKGMREDRVRDIAARLRTHARWLDEATADVQKAVATLRPVWTGPDAAAFVRRSGAMVHDVESAAAGVRQLSAELFAELQAQVEASAVSDGHGDGPSVPLDQTTEQDGPDIPLDPDLPVRPQDLLWALFGDDSPWTPQGLAIDAGGGLLLTTIYNAHDTADGLLVIQDAATGEVLNTVRLAGIDHYGGVAVHGDHVWVSGAGQVQLYSLSELRAADNGSTAPVHDSFPVDGYSTVTYHDGQLWTAQFNGARERPDLHLRRGRRRQRLGHPELGHGWRAGDAGHRGQRRLRLRLAVRGPRRGAQHPHPDRPGHGGAGVDRDPVDMAEGIALHGNQLVQTYESGAAQYADGREPRSTTTVRDLD